MMQRPRFADSAGPLRRLMPRRKELPAFVLQAALLVLIGVFAALVATNVTANVARLNLHVGFGFLFRTAGFEIAQTAIPYSENSTYLIAFLAALINTILLAVISIVCGTILGFAIALARLSTNPLLSSLAHGYIELVRNIPLLLQLFFWYFAVLATLPSPRQSLNFFNAAFLNNRGLSLPAPLAGPGLPLFLLTAAIGIGAAVFLFTRARRYRVASGRPAPGLMASALACLCAPVLVTALTGAPVIWDIPHLAGFNIDGGVAVIPEFVAMAVGMSVYGSAFIAELVRGAIAAVNDGQAEAGRALGLSPWRINTKIVIPQALRFILPPLIGQYVSLLKNSSLASAIGYPDLMLIFAGTALNQTGQPLEIMAMTMASYLLLCLLISSIGNIVNRRLRLVER